ncbi:PP2C family protein-serine/threonine phosphatase [Streptomyces sp. NPDC005953]|uniref:PP2C family protein-serine/threonine phosphatase n=1 Tax=unclassified Streptomyces TaxID=2593676 RepID=UPI0033DD1E5C
MDRLTARWPYVRWLPLTVIVVVAVADAATPTAYTGVPLIASACVLAGATLSLRGTAWTGAFALVITLLLNWRLGLLEDATGWVEVFNVGLALLIGLDVNRMLDRYTRQLARVRSVAGAMQRAVLPSPPARIGLLEVAARYEGADTEARIGGDLYTIQDTPYGVRILVGDVRGKGLGAVSTTSTLIGAFREAAHYVPDLADLAVRLERSLARDSAENPNGGHDEEFTTALIAEIDHRNHTLHMLNRGHPAPYLIRAGRITELTPAAPDLPLGMGGLGGQRTLPDAFPLSAGDILLFVTDGVTEARNRRGDFYDPIHLATSGNGPAGPAAVLDALADAIHQWTGGPRDDDMATLAIGIV